MKKCSFLLVSIFIISTYGFSQNISLNVISSQGDINTTNEMTLEWTLGEPFVETVVNNNYILTQGFHQSFIDSLSVSINTTLGISLNSVVYPNPIINLLNIHLSKSEDSRYNIIMYELNGGIVRNLSLKSIHSIISINVMDFSPGIYILNISSLNGDFQETHKLIKN